jgi:RNA recognition motif-containing protein
MNIYVGNLSFDATENDLREAFEAFGQVSSVNIIKDRYSGKSRGFGFVEMADEAGALVAIDSMNGKPLKDRQLKVNKARPRPEGRRPGERGAGRRF